MVELESGQWYGLTLIKRKNKQLKIIELQSGEQVTGFKKS